jgi:hypothetical protein
VARLVVCNPRKNALLKQGNKSDRIDARKLAELLRGNSVLRSAEDRAREPHYDNTQLRSASRIASPLGYRSNVPTERVARSASYRCLCTNCARFLSEIERAGGPAPLCSRPGVRAADPQIRTFASRLNIDFEEIVLGFEVWGGAWPGPRATTNEFVRS